MSKEHRYALLDAKGSPATLCHQDDEETPIVSSTLKGLIYAIAEWGDVGEDTVLKALREDLTFDNGDLGGEEEVFKIVRQVVVTKPTTEDDKAKVKRMIEANAKEEQKYQTEREARRKTNKLYFVFTAKGVPLPTPKEVKEWTVSLGVSADDYLLLLQEQDNKELRQQLIDYFNDCNLGIVK